MIVRFDLTRCLSSWNFFSDIFLVYFLTTGFAGATALQGDGDYYELCISAAFFTVFGTFFPAEAFFSTLTFRCSFGSTPFLDRVHGQVSSSLDHCSKIEEIRVTFKLSKLNLLGLFSKIT